jgi:hypothetical protein
MIKEEEVKQSSHEPQNIIEVEEIDDLSVDVTTLKFWRLEKNGNSVRIPQIILR